MPTTVENLADKAYAAIVLSFAARGVEAAGITWENVSRTINSVTKESQITIRYKRTKTTGVPETLVALINGRCQLIRDDHRGPRRPRAQATRRRSL